jgi:capsid assembly protease
LAEANSKTYSRAASLFFDVPLAIEPTKRDALIAFWEAKLQGASLEWGEKQEPFAVTYAAIDDDLDGFVDPDSGEPRRRGKIAVLPLYGTISQRMNMMTQVSGGTSTELFGEAFRAQLNDPEVRSIVLNIDSPGGSSYGVSELANLIMDARGRKPIVAFANSVAASAAYWIGAAADHFYVTPGGLVGSIGVYAVHQDVSKRAEDEGIQTTLISAGKNKTRGNPFGPLSDDDVAHIQALVDDTYSMFIRDVARGRRVAQTKVRSGYGQGDVLTATDALHEGMVDGVKTFDEVLAESARLKPRKPQPAMRAAEAAELDESPRSGLTFAEQIQEFLFAAQEIGVRIKSRAEFRQGEGRSLSEEQQVVIHQALVQAEAIFSEIKVSVPRPDAADAAKVLRLQRWKAAQAQAAALGIAVAAEE